MAIAVERRPRLNPSDPKVSRMVMRDCLAVPGVFGEAFRLSPSNIQRDDSVFRLSSRLIVHSQPNRHESGQTYGIEPPARIPRLRTLALGPTGSFASNAHQEE